MKNRNSIMPESYEEFISLTLRTRNSRKPSRMLARNWKHRWLLLCLCKTSKKCKPGEQARVMQGVLSHASFRRSAVSGQKFFTVLSLHISNIYAKKKGIAKKLVLTLRAIMISQKVDLVAGDVNGTAWRCRSRDNLSTIDEAFTDCALPTPPSPTPLWRPSSIPDNWADACGFLKPPGSDRFWKVNKHCAFSIPRKTLGLRPTDQNCHHETWLHLEFVDWSNTWSREDDYQLHISLKERPPDCSYRTQKRHISEVMSDHSLWA